VVAVAVGHSSTHGRIEARVGLEASVRTQRDHERARFALPATSAVAWRTRSPAAGLPRDVSFMP